MENKRRYNSLKMQWYQRSVFSSYIRIPVPEYMERVLDVEFIMWTLFTLEEVLASSLRWRISNKVSHRKQEQVLWPFFSQKVTSVRTYWLLQMPNDNCESLVFFVLLRLPKTRFHLIMLRNNLPPGTSVPVGLLLFCE